MFADTPEQKDRVFLILTGIWLFTALLLFGNPVILDYLHPVKDIGIPTQSIGVTPEDDSNARPYLGILAVLGLACVRGFSRLAKPKFQLPAALPLWIAWLPLGWFGFGLTPYDKLPRNQHRANNHVANHLLQPEVETG